MNRKLTVFILISLFAFSLAAALAVASWWQTLALARSFEDSLQNSQLRIQHQEFQSTATGIRAHQFELNSPAARIRAPNLALSIPLSALWTRATHALQCDFENASIELDLQQTDQLPSLKWPSLNFKRGRIVLRFGESPLAKWTFRYLSVLKKDEQIQIIGRGKIQVLAPYAEHLGIALKDAPSQDPELEVSGQIDLKARSYRVRFSATGLPYITLTGPQLVLMTKEIFLSGSLREPLLQMELTSPVLSWIDHLDLTSDALRIVQRGENRQYFLNSGEAVLHEAQLQDLFVKFLNQTLEASNLALFWQKPQAGNASPQKSALAQNAKITFKNNQLQSEMAAQNGRVQAFGALDDQGRWSQLHFELQALSWPELQVSGHLEARALPEDALRNAALPNAESYPQNPYALQGDVRLDWADSTKTHLKTSAIFNGYPYKGQISGNMLFNDTPANLFAEWSEETQRAELRFEELECQKALSFLPRSLLAFYDPHELDSSLRPRIIFENNQLRVKPTVTLPEFSSLQLPCRAKPISRTQAEPQLTKNLYDPDHPWRILTEHGPVYVFGLPREGKLDLPKNSEVIVYVHGYWENVDQIWRNHHLAEQFRQSGRQALFVLPEAPLENADNVHWPNLRELLQAIRNTGIRVPQGPVTAIGHSGAYRTLVSWLGESILRQVILIDGLYANEDAFANYVQQKRGQLIMVGAQTNARGLRFGHRFQQTHYYRELPQAFSDADRRASLIYISSQRGHWELITDGVVIPQLLKQLPVQAHR